MKGNKNSQKENKKNDKKKCFIIMPITTPDSMIEKYAGGKDHFTYVLNQIFIPAIKKSDLEPIPPKTKGSGIIHGEIIKNLETSDLVLCDMSTLNPNVFFEFGIRTSLNKPVVLVVDDKTPEIPFDPSIIHYHKYRSAMQNWTYDDDVKLLSQHISECLKRSKGENSLWKYFGLSSIAYSDGQKSDVDKRLDYLTRRIEMISEDIRRQESKEDMSRLYTYAPLPKGESPFSEETLKILLDLMTKTDPSLWQIVSKKLEK